MATKLGIANEALAEINSAPIQSLEENTGVARKVAALIDGTLEDVQTVYDWPILRRTAVLIPSVEVSTTGDIYDNAFQIPNNAIIKFVTDSSGFKHYDYRIENGHIYSNLSTMHLRYSTKLSEVTDFQDYLKMVCVAALAIRLSGPIASVAIETRNVLELKFEKILSRAKVIASREGPPIQVMPDDESRFIGAHYGSTFQNASPFHGHS
jgi:hypothetical protein